MNRFDVWYPLQQKKKLLTKVAWEVVWPAMCFSIKNLASSRDVFLKVGARWRQTWYLRGSLSSTNDTRSLFPNHPAVRDQKAARAWSPEAAIGSSPLRLRPASMSYALTASLIRVSRKTGRPLISLKLTGAAYQEGFRGTTIKKEAIETPIVLPQFKAPGSGESGA